MNSNGNDRGHDHYHDDNMDDSNNDNTIYYSILSDINAKDKEKC